MKKDIYFRIYNDIYFYLWEMTFGQGGSKRDYYRGAKLYGSFLLSEIDRHNEVEAIGETAIERRGLVSPVKVMKAWAFNILEECHIYRIVPPMELIDAIYSLLGCSHDPAVIEERTLRDEFIRLNNGVTRIGVREAARHLGVNPSTITRIKKDLDDYGPREDNERWGNLYPDIFQKTKVREFVPPRFRVA